MDQADVTALGAFRRLGCSCNEIQQDLDTCPYHSMTSQLSWLKEQHASLSETDFADLPVFPTCDGDIPAKAAIVQTVRHAAQLLGEPLRSSNGAEQFGGHTPRATGAVFYAQAGVDTWRIQSLGRWGSDAIKSYLRGAHVSGLATISQEASLGKSLESSRAELLALQNQARILRNKLAAAIHEESELPHTSSGSLLALTSSDVLDGTSLPAEEEKPSEPAQDLPYVHNTKTGALLHIISICSLDIPSQNWRSSCVWRFGRDSRFAERTSDPMASQQCPNCFKLSRAGWNRKKKSASDGSVQLAISDQIASPSSSSSSSSS